MSTLFSPFPLRSLTLRNRIGVSPMCQYSSVNGHASDWHLVHLGAFATGGAALVLTEAAAVLPEGRISPSDLGIWDDAHVATLQRITAFVREQGTVVGIQLAHAGRKASTTRPWDGHRAVSPSEGGWTNVMAPSAIAYNGDYAMPVAMTETDIASVISAFSAAASRALASGFQLAEVHAAHGYLLHQFLSPLSNHRTDGYGGGFAERIRLTVEVCDAVRAVWPDSLPVVVRLSATDWADGGWTVEESVALATILRGRGIDLVDCSSAGLVPQQQIVVEPGYQVPFARAIRDGASIPTAAVGLITEAEQAERIVADGDADLVFMARELLRNPHWPLLAAHTLGVDAVWPEQYARARLRR